MLIVNLRHLNCICVDNMITERVKQNNASLLKLLLELRFAREIFFS